MLAFQTLRSKSIYSASLDPNLRLFEPQLLVHVFNTLIIQINTRCTVHLQSASKHMYTKHYFNDGFSTIFAQGFIQLFYTYQEEDKSP